MDPVSIQLRFCKNRGMCTSLKIHKYIVLVAAILFTFVAESKNNTPKDYKCYNKVGGEWKYGRGPNGCDVAPFQNPSFVAREFKDVIFDDNVNWDTERERYMQELFALVRDVDDRPVRHVRWQFGVVKRGPEGIRPPYFVDTSSS